MIKVGDAIPKATLIAATPDGPKEMTTGELFDGHKVVVFAVPGAFTPTCSAKHMPGFLNNAEALRAKGVDQIACIAVNDPFVMNAWAKDQEVGDRVLMLSDGMAQFTKSLGLELDLSARGLGIRSSRYAMVIEDGIVTLLNVEQPGGYEVSSADDQGRIVAFAITAGQLGDARAAYGLLAPLPAAQLCLADGGYDSNDLRRFLAERGSQPVIPNNPTRKHLHPFDPVAYRARNLIERAFCRMKDWRRLATRYEAVLEAL